MKNQQNKQKENNNGNKFLRKFDVGDSMYLKDLPAVTPKWIPGSVEKVTSHLLHVVKL